MLRTHLRGSFEPQTISQTSKSLRSWFYANEIRDIYEIPAPLSSRMVVGVISFGGGLYGTLSNRVLTNGDVQAYWTSIGIAPEHHPQVFVVPINGASNLPNANDGGSTMENTLDVETIGACCPTANLTIILYLSPNTLNDFYNVLNYALNQPLTVGGTSYQPTILSISWGAPEAYFSTSLANNMNNLMGVANASGVNICVASGDYGSSNGLGSNTDVNADFPSASPCVTACGGTNLVCPNYVYDGSTIERAWSSGGGAVSAKFSKPSYQSGLGGSGRATPDVALVADPDTGVLFRVNGQNYVFGGTSVAAPIFAGFLACVNPSVFVNPILYSSSGANFHDVTEGSNGAFTAGVGYDNCTGLGSIVGSVLKTTLEDSSDGPVTSMTLNVSTKTLSTREIFQLIPTFSPSVSPPPSVSWASSSPGVVTVTSGGLLTARSRGNATITATSGEFIATVVVTVIIGVTGVRISPTSTTLYRRGSKTLKASVLPSAATNRAVTWASSNPSIVTVSSTGIIRAGMLKGNTYITVTTANGSFQARCRVSVW